MSSKPNVVFPAQRKLGAGDGDAAMLGDAVVLALGSVDGDSVIHILGAGDGDAVLLVHQLALVSGSAHICRVSQSK